METSKWLEHHFGSDSRSSNNSTIDEEEQPPKTSFFNVTIKSQPTRTEPVPQSTFVSTINNTPKVYSPVEPERDRNHHNGGYYKGIHLDIRKGPLTLGATNVTSFLTNTLT